MGWWAKSVILFNALREYGQQSIWSLAERTESAKYRGAPLSGTTLSATLKA